MKALNIDSFSKLMWQYLRKGNGERLREVRGFVFIDFNYRLTDYSSAKTFSAPLSNDLVCIYVSNVNEDIYSLLVIFLGNIDRIMLQKRLDNESKER